MTEKKFDTLVSGIGVFCFGLVVLAAILIMVNPLHKALLTDTVPKTIFECKNDATFIMYPSQMFCSNCGESVYDTGIESENTIFDMFLKRCNNCNVFIEVTSDYCSSCGIENNHHYTVSEWLLQNGFETKEEYLVAINIEKTKVEAITDALLLFITVASCICICYIILVRILEKYLHVAKDMEES